MVEIGGGRRFNPAAFAVPRTGQQGTLGRNVLRELPVYQFDVSVGRISSIYLLDAAAEVGLAAAWLLAGRRG